MRWAHPSRTRSKPAPQEPAPVAVEAVPIPSIVQRPDGSYWLSTDGRREFGPFDTAGEAESHMEASSEEAPQPGETLREAEDALGIADGVDSETGELAEDSRTRLEDH